MMFQAGFSTCVGPMLARTWGSKAVPNDPPGDLNLLIFLYNVRLSCRIDFLDVVAAFWVPFYMNLGWTFSILWTPCKKQKHQENAVPANQIKGPPPARTTKKPSKNKAEKGKQGKRQIHTFRITFGPISTCFCTIWDHNLPRNLRDRRKSSKESRQKRLQIFGSFWDHFGSLLASKFGPFLLQTANKKRRLKTGRVVGAGNLVFTPSSRPNPLLFI